MPEKYNPLLWLALIVSLVSFFWGLFELLWGAWLGVKWLASA